MVIDAVNIFIKKLFMVGSQNACPAMMDSILIEPR